jgi:ribosomal protein S18 acetylase RimI-like enzyme
MIRQITFQEVKTASDLADLVYPSELGESLESFQKRFSFYPPGFLGYFVSDALVGYITGHPWKGNDVVPLNYDFASPVKEPDRFYIHDVAIAAEHRGKLYSKLLFNSLLNKGRYEGFGKFMCVAVSGAGKKLAETFGFGAVAEIQYADKVKGYKMVKED